MIIVLTGMQAINKKFMARYIINELNSFEYKGFYGNFLNSDFEIYNADKELVYKPMSDTTSGCDLLLSISSESFDIIDYFSKLNIQIFENDIKHNHFVDVFCSLEIDYNLSDVARFTIVDELVLHPCKFEDVVNNIKNSTLQHKVITGTFGGIFLDKLKLEFPHEEIAVLNIIRNPSASYIFNKKPLSKWRAWPNPDVIPEIDDQRFYEAILNSIELAKRSDVITLRFEDMIKEKLIKISDNLSIPLPEHYYSFNNYITIGESISSILMPEYEFEGFNEKISNYTAEDWYDEDESDLIIFKKSREEIIDLIKIRLPSNFFEELNYSPLTYYQVLEGLM